MATGSGKGSNKVDTQYDYGAIAIERTLWAIRPIITMALVLWVFYPDTTFPDAVDRNALMGFLLGALFSLFIFRKELRYYLVTRRNDTENMKNRMPDKYYFGRILKILFRKAGG